MKKIILLLGLLIVLSVSSKGQFKSAGLLQNYRILVNELEPSKPISSNGDSYLTWMDTIVSIHREIAEYFEISFPLDTALLLKEGNKDLSKEDIEKIRQIKFIKMFPNFQQSSLAGKKKQKAKRFAYELQRLSLIKTTFAKAKADSNLVLMGSSLELLVIYYQNRTLLSTPKALKTYQKEFISMRREYANILALCLDKETCNKNHISILFAVSLNAWPDLGLAQSVLQKWYNQEWLYLFRGVDIVRLDKVSFVTAIECYLSLLYFYNIAGRTEAHELIRAFERLMEIPFSSWEKETIKTNLRRYLNQKQKVFPQ